MTCQICRRDIPPIEPTYRLSTGYSTPLPGVLGIAYVCARCAFKWGAWGREWHAPRACQSCGKSVVHDSRRRLPNYIVCGVQCRQTIRSRLKKQGLRALVCQTCGEKFLAKRYDALYCSPLCRQRAYLQRRDSLAE